MSEFSSPSFARATDPDTSHAAAESMCNSNLHEIVFGVIKKAGSRGATLDDLEDAIKGSKVVSISPVPARLEEKGLIYDTGQRRRGRSGRYQRVLRVTEEGGDPAPPKHSKAQSAYKTLRALGYLYLGGTWAPPIARDAPDA